MTPFRGPVQVEGGSLGCRSFVWKVFSGSGPFARMARRLLAFTLR